MSVCPHMIFNIFSMQREDGFVVLGSKFHLFHVLCHFAGADVVDILIFVMRKGNALVNALLEFALVELHGQHVCLHLSLPPTHALVVLLK